MILFKHYRRMIWVTICVVAFILVCCNAVISIWATAYGRDEVTVNNLYPPLYSPITSHRHAEKISQLFPRWLPAEQGERTFIEQAPSGIVHYPHEPLACAVTDKPNILLIAVDSLQADVLNPTVMPTSWQLANAAGSTRFENHLSGGSVTVTGLFSLLTGLHASYHNIFQHSASQNPSLLTEFLQQQGYDINVYTESNLSRFRLKDLIFPDVKSQHFHHTSSDAETLAMLQKKTVVKKDKPFFDFVFFTSSHAPYRYPESFTQFTPLPDIEGGYALNRFVDNTRYKNDYYNSVYYVDDLIRQTLVAYQANEQLDNTWIIITGDHAEEFNETKQGNWGHGSNFSRWQVQVPLIIKRPNKQANQVISARTLHQDLVPTLLKNAFHCKTMIASYSNGEDLFTTKPHRDTVVSSYFDDAYVINENVYEKKTLKQYLFETASPVSDGLSTPAYKALFDAQRWFLK